MLKAVPHPFANETSNMSPSSELPDYEKCQHAVFDCYFGDFSEKRSTLAEAAAQHHISIGRIRRAMGAWTPTEAQPQQWNNIQFNMRSVERTNKIEFKHESTIAEAVRYYVENKTPMSKQGIRPSVEHLVSILPLKEQEKVGSTNNIPSPRWVKRFAERHNLSYRKVQQV